MSKEVVCTDRLSPSSGRELHFSVKWNRVSWWVLPRGESGRSKAFRDAQAMNGFMRGFALSSGFTAEENMVNGQFGVEPGWHRVYERVKNLAGRFRNFGINLPLEKR